MAGLQVFRCDPICVEPVYVEPVCADPSTEHTDASFYPDETNHVIDHIMESNAHRASVTEKVGKATRTLRRVISAVGKAVLGDEDSVGSLLLRTDSAAVLEQNLNASNFAGLSRCPICRDVKERFYGEFRQSDESMRMAISTDPILSSKIGRSMSANPKRNIIVFSIAVSVYLFTSGPEKYEDIYDHHNDDHHNDEATTKDYIPACAEVGKAQLGWCVLELGLCIFWVFLMLHRMNREIFFRAAKTFDSVLMFVAFLRFVRTRQSNYLSCYGPNSLWDIDTADWCLLFCHGAFDLVWCGFIAVADSWREPPFWKRCFYSGALVVTILFLIYYHNVQGGWNDDHKIDLFITKDTPRGQVISTNYMVLGLLLKHNASMWAGDNAFVVIKNKLKVVWIRNEDKQEFADPLVVYLDPNNQARVRGKIHKEPDHDVMIEEPQTDHDVKQKGEPKTDDAKQKGESQTDDVIRKGEPRTDIKHNIVPTHENYVHIPVEIPHTILGNSQVDVTKSV